MSYFSLNDHQSLTSSQAHRLNSDTDLQRVYNKLFDLHKVVYGKLRNHNIFIHSYSQQSNIIQFQSASCTSGSETMTVPYFRSGAEAEMVEGLMGRSNGTFSRTGEARLHPVIEMRVSPDHFAVELVVSPEAWWDQQNLLGKLASKRHRAVFFKLLTDLGDDYRMGFWNGIALNDMHLTTGQLSPRALYEWMETFEDGHDWYRVGYWHAPEDPAIHTDTVIQTVFNHIDALYPLYSFMLWTSNNNFRHLCHRKRMAVPA